MCKILIVTNRRLYQGDFLERAAQIASCRPDGIILRETDLPEPDYSVLAEKVKKICDLNDVPFFLHSHPDAVPADRLHMPLKLLREMPDAQKQKFARIGSSCHSVSEAQEAVQLGADYVIAGHIFATDCKKGLPGRGTDFLREVCAGVSVPVYAIGGITPEKVPEVMQTGAAGICVMSGLMQAGDPFAYYRELREACRNG